MGKCFEVLGDVPKVVLADRMACLKGAVVANVVVPSPDYVRLATPVDGPNLTRRPHRRTPTASRHNARTYAVSLTADVAGTWYRRRDLDRVGIEPPRTWTDLHAAGRALLAAGIAHPVVLPGGSKGDETTTYCLLAFLAANGAKVLGPDAHTAWVCG